MKRMKILLGMLFLLSSMSFATGFQFNFAGNQVPESEDVSGLRLNLFYGKTANVSGVDFNLVALGETDNFKGLQFGFIGANKVNNSFTGLGMGIVNLHKGDSKGVLWGLVNMSNDVKGVQLGGVNYSTGRTTVDFGLVNISQGTTFQMGLVNMTDDLTGVQLGLVNIAKTGFLPIFPFFNIDGRIF
ncbi:MULTISPECIES: VC2662 family protein [Psychrilyobacter]|uniref:PhaC PHA synthase n=1 Tax=Psychrilyobacter piezotolerans TaxID=2293438 RepID=A0ABX9KJK0_9FUSO|nr:MULTISPECIES: phaC PHA synthase [Psychrilyobacter]MCS5421766.1 phaC PHA synthase [Psychrilyobacter sp. S5]NDI77070.1 phaC PHA synthase [Psychrilyobacter piezotolerans]RDE64686.1 phaC PHA synthase [Psychrilyobacter sp. S5]REI42498.1 phaC PHA synthase [Psychrilyobacter piezotolerans]